MNMSITKIEHYPVGNEVLYRDTWYAIDEVTIDICKDNVLRYYYTITDKEGGTKVVTPDKITLL